MTFDTVTWILGTNLGLVSIATIFASAWIRVSRIDKIEADVESLKKDSIRVSVLESKMTAIEDGIKEIKEMIKEQRDRNV